MKIISTKKNDKDVEYVTGINIYFTNEYLEGTYGSCKQVSMPSTGQLAMDVMCGSWAAAKCNAMRWFTYIGETKDNPYVPFRRVYVNTSVPLDGFTPLNPTITPCSKGIDVSILTR